MSFPIAIIFEGMPLPIFLGVWASVVLLTGALFFGYRRFNDLEVALRPFWWTLGGLIVLLIMIGSAVWRTWFCPPLPLPPNARDTEIFSWEWWSERSKDRMRFKINEPEFIKWVEVITSHRWSELDQNPVKLHFTAFGNRNSPRDVANSTQVMDLIGKCEAPSHWNIQRVRSGYLIRPKTGKIFFGQLLFDSEREVVYYMPLKEP